MISTPSLTIHYRGRTFLAPESPIDHLRTIFGHDDPRLVSGFSSTDALADFLFRPASDIASSGSKDIDLDLIGRWATDEYVEEVDLVTLDTFNSFMAEVLSLLPEQAAKRAQTVIEQSLDASNPLWSVVVDAKLAYHLDHCRDGEAFAGEDVEKRMAGVARQPPRFWGTPPAHFSDVMKDHRMKKYIVKLIGLFGDLAIR